MSVIQKIRDKYARWAVIAIALSLLGFILMDAFAGKTGAFGNSQDKTIGKVDGKEIDAATFAKKLQAQETAENRQGYQGGEERRQQLVQGLWDQEVTEIVMNREYEKLGLTVSDKEMDDVLYGNDAPADLKQRFTDEKTGQYNAVAAKQFINSVSKSGAPEDIAQLENYMASLKSQRLMNKYTALLSNSIVFPKWFLEKRNVDNSLLGNISFVAVPYTTISDSTVKVTDDEIKNYINDHKDLYKQDNETRSLSFISFSAAPSSADSAATLKQVLTLKPQFQAAADPGNFVQQQGSTYPYYDAFLGKSTIQIPVKDSVLNLPKGAIYGPYLDGGNYVLARMIDMKSLPDSAKARHILLGTVNPQTGQPLMDDSTAKKRIDSIFTAIKGGASFDSLAKKYSSDQSSANKGGLVGNPNNPNTDYFLQGQMVKAFNDSIFNGYVGKRMIVKSEFGYHLIEILDLKNIEPHYKVAYVAKPILASTETDNLASQEANLFVRDSRDLKSFNENFDKNLRPKGYNKLLANDINEMDYNLARPSVEGLIRNKKKAEMLIKNIGKFSSLQEVSGKFNSPVQTADSLVFNGSNKVLGYESKIIGAAFNPANKGKLVNEPIAGTQGVYVIQVNSVTTIPVVSASLEAEAMNMEMQQRQAMTYRPPTDVLKKGVKIKDNRSKFY
jgi:peptidyl-prolyl cis-trans isomerase D